MERYPPAAARHSEYSTNVFKLAPAPGNLQLFGFSGCSGGGGGVFIGIGAHFGHEPGPAAAGVVSGGGGGDSAASHSLCLRMSVRDGLGGSGHAATADSWGLGTIGAVVAGASVVTVPAQ